MCFEAASEHIRLALADERLQKILIEIDGSRDPESSLELALSRDAAFEAFASQVGLRNVDPICFLDDTH